jgi:hypothetical protein
VDVMGHFNQLGCRQFAQIVDDRINGGHPGVKLMHPGEDCETGPRSLAESQRLPQIDE